MIHDIVSVTFDRSDGHPNGGRYSCGDRIWGPTYQKLYDYRAQTGLLEEGDQAVVDSPYGTAVVTVRRVNGECQYKGTKKWVVCKVDRTAARRREELARDIDELNASIQAEVDRLLATRAVEWAVSKSRLVRDSVELLGELSVELEGLGGR